MPAALTGPISRGDLAVVAGHLEALVEPALTLYRLTASATVELARRQGRAPADALDAIAQLVAQVDAAEPPPKR